MTTRSRWSRRSTARVQRAWLWAAREHVLGGVGSSTSRTRLLRSTRIRARYRVPRPAHRCVPRRSHRRAPRGDQTQGRRISASRLEAPADQLPARFRPSRRSVALVRPRARVQAGSALLPLEGWAAISSNPRSPLPLPLPLPRSSPCATQVLRCFAFNCSIVSSALGWFGSVRSRRCQGMQWRS